MAAPPSPRRRALLRRGVAAAGAVLTTGCLSLPGRDSDESRADAPPEDGPAIVTHALETVAEGLDHAWGLAFLPEGGLLVTERPGDLVLVDRETGDVERIAGVPDVAVGGQGGLLDVTLHPDFPADPWVYLTFARANEADETATHLARGRLDPDEVTLSGVEVLHVAEPFVDSTGHYGSRVVFGPDGMVYVTTGDRQFKDFGPDHVSQDRTNELGATLRLTPDGSVPADNPFVADPDAADSLFTYGHRNAQGMTVHPETGAIWQSEHGEEDGDALNVLEAGGNYGWPVAHTGCAYGTTTPVGEDPFEREDVVDPVYHWACETGGFPPAGMTFYDGDAIPAFEGDLFVGNLAGRYLGRFAVDGRSVTEAEPLLAEEGWRVRDVAVAPDSEHLYVAIDAADAPLVRVTPA